MALNTFGGSPADVTTDSAGNAIPGLTVKAYTAPVGGMQITELYDLNGTPLPGVITSGTGPDAGRIAFQAAEQYQVIYLDAGYGMRWAVPARDVYIAATTALDQSTTALATASSAQDTAVTAEAKADAASAKIDREMAVDITTQAPEFVAQLQIDPATVAQSFARDELTGEYYVSQGLGSIGSTTNLVVHRCSASGEILDTCTFEGGGHGSTTAIERVGTEVWLWFRWTYDSSGGSFTNSMVRAKYQGGEVVLRNDAGVIEVMDVSGGSLVNYDIDQSADRICLRISISSSQQRYELHRLSAYKTGVNAPLAKLGPYTSGGEVGPYQGHCSLDDYLYESKGNADTGSQCTITRYSWTTGSVDIVNVTQVGAYGGAWPGGRNENEGITVWRNAGGAPSILFGKAVGAFGYRQALVYAIKPPSVGSVSSESLRRALQKQRGTVTITPTAVDTPTSATVTYKHEFNGIPHVTVTADTTAPGTTVSGVSATLVTATSCQIWVTSADLTPVTVSWQADAS